MTVHYVYFADETEDFNLANAKGGEKDEVESAEWFDIATFKNEKELSVDIPKMYEMDFAFNHDKLIIEHLSKFFKITY